MEVGVLNRFCDELAEALGWPRPNLLFIAVSPNDVPALDYLFNTIPFITRPAQTMFYRDLYKLPGFLKEKLPWIPDKLLYMLGLVVTRARDPLASTPLEAVDMVLAYVNNRFNLAKLGGAVKIHFNGDCINPSRLYTSIYTARVAEVYELVLVPHRSCIETYAEYGVKAFFYPYYANPLLHRRMRLKRRYDIVFVGRLVGRRRELIARLRRELGKESVLVVNEWRHNMVAYYNMARIVLNVSRMRELNMRVFEALGSGSFLLTDRSPEVEELFVDGKHLVMYDDVDDLVEKAKRYLRDAEEREAIALEGYREVVTKHTIFHRVLSLLDLLAARARLPSRLRELVARRSELRMILSRCSEKVYREAGLLAEEPS